MAIEEFIIKLVSEFDDSGFEKFENSQSDAQKSTKKLSESLKKTFLPFKIPGQIFGNPEILNDPENSFVNSKTLPSFVMKTAPSRFKNAPSSGSTLFCNQSSGMQKFMSSILNFFAGGLFLNKSSENPNVFSQNKLFQADSYSFTGGRVLNNSNTISKEMRPQYFSEFSSVSGSGGNFSGKNILHNYNNLSSGTSKLLREIALFANITTSTGANLFSPVTENFTPGTFSLSSTNVNNSTNSTVSTKNGTSSEDVSSSTDSVNLNISEGAIQINTGSGNPDEIGSAVRNALTDALDDFILKRGYTKAV